MDVVSQILNTVIWIFGIVIVGLVVGLTIINMKYKHFIRVRQIVKGRPIIIDDKAREFKDKSGIIWWKLRKLKQKISPPPSDCMDITSKGKIAAEFYKTADGALIPIKDDFNINDYEQHYAFVEKKVSDLEQKKAYYAELSKRHENKEDLTKEETQFLREFDIKKELKEFEKISEVQKYAHYFMANFRPLVTQERALLSHEHMKAEEYKKKNKMEWVQMALVWGVPLIMLVMALIFAPDIIGSVGKLLDKVDVIMDKADLILAKTSQISSGTIELTNTTVQGGVPN